MVPSSAGSTPSHLVCCRRTSPPRSGLSREAGHGRLVMGEGYRRALQANRQAWEWPRHRPPRPQRHLQVKGKRCCHLPSTGKFDRCPGRRLLARSRRAPVRGHRLVVLSRRALVRSCRLLILDHRALVQSRRLFLLSGRAPVRSPGRFLPPVGRGCLLCREPTSAHRWIMQVRDRRCGLGAQR